MQWGRTEDHFKTTLTSFRGTTIILATSWPSVVARTFSSARAASRSSASLAVELAKIVEEAGAPAGLMNVVLGKGDVGAALADHPGIAKISLTGSVPTGKRVMAAAAGTLKHVTMELGGKSALIVFADADLDDAVAAALLGNFYTQGEICSNGTRVFVEEPVRAAFVEKLVARTKKIRVGDPLDPQTQMGPLISAEHLEKVLGYVARGETEGATAVHRRAGEAEIAVKTAEFIVVVVLTHGWTRESSR